MALFRVITLFIHAIVAAMASMLVAVFTHLLPGLLVIVVLVGVATVLCTSCGIGGVAMLRRKGKQRQ